MDAKVYLSKIEEIVGAKFEGNSIDLEFPRENVAEARLQRLKIVRMQKVLGRIHKAVSAEIDALKSTYEERKANVRPEFWSWLSYPSAKKSKEQQMARIIREENSALTPLKKVRGVIFAIQFSLDQIMGRLDSEIEQESVSLEK